MTNITDILSTKSVLYAEDEVEVSKNTIEILELFFNKVVYVQNGEDALDEFLCSHFDVLMFDICMPKMDGFQAIEQIRKKIIKSLSLYFRLTHKKSIFGKQ
jgi:CheY-like chemotaxis protein